MATKSKIVRIVGKMTHPLMSWSNITDQSFENGSSSESAPKQQIVELEPKSVPSNDSLKVIMKNGKRNSKTSSLNASSTSLGSINSQIRLYIQRRLGRQRQELSVYKSKNEANEREQFEVDTENNRNYSSKSSRKIKPPILEKPAETSQKRKKRRAKSKIKADNLEKQAETSITVEKQRAKPKIKKKVKFQTVVAKSNSKNKIDVMVNSANKKLQRKPRQKSPAKRNAVAKKNLNLKARNKVPVIAAQESNDENFELNIHISESENDVDIKQSKKKVDKKKKSERKPHIISRKSKKSTKINADVAERDLNIINIDLQEENLKVEEVPSIKTSVKDEEADHSRPNILHINPKQMGKSETVVENQDSTEFPLVGIDEAVNNVEKKVIIMELKPSEINKSENAWKLASKHLKDRFTRENFAYLDSESSVSELLEDDKLVAEPSKIIENRSSPSAYLIVNTENEKRSSNLSHKLPIDETDHLEMKWRMAAMKQLLKGDLDRELLEDIVLKVGNKSYSCCRLLLVLTSRFFRQQLRVGNLEPFTTSELRIEAADEKTVGAVFEWMHTAEIDLNMTNIGEILHLCDILGIDSLAEKCQGMLEVLREHDGDAVSLYEYAAENKMSKVAKEAAEIVSDNFLKVVYGEKFLNYTFKQMYMLLCLEDLRVNSEVEVFYAVWRWLSHSWNYRKRYKDQLIHCVNLEKMSEREVQVLAETLMEGELGEENPLTWGTDSYVLVGLIRGLLSGNKKHLLGWNKKTEEESPAIVVQKPIFEWAINKKHLSNGKKKKRMRKDKAARIIQTAYNEYKERKWWKMLNRAALEIQRWFRGFAARKKMKKRVKSAVVIQRAFRKSKDHERRNKLLRLAAPKPRKKYIKRKPVKRTVK